MIEVLCQEFLPLFVLTNEKHYVEIVLGMIDTLHSKLNCMQLQLVRINRTVPSCSSQEKQENKPMSNWALDAIIELIQKYYHQMRFKNEKGWAVHSPHVMFTNKASRHESKEHMRSYDKENFEERFLGLSTSPDQHRSREKTAKKCRELEHIIIAECLSLLNVSVETNNRKHNVNEFRNAMSKITTELIDESEEERSMRKVMESMTEEEKNLSHVVADIFNKGSNENTDKETADATMDTTIDPSTMFNDDFHAGINEPIENDDLDSDSLNDDSEVEVVVGKKKKRVNVRFAKVNPHCFEDIFKIAKKMMEKQQINKIRFRNKERIKRNMECRKKIHDSIMRENELCDALNKPFDRLENLGSQNQLQGSGLTREFRSTCVNYFKIDPHEWQSKLGNLMLNENVNLLCVRPTGGGKTLLYQVVASCKKLITLVISPLLTLGTDQTQKALNTHDESISAFHLDELTEPSLNRLLSLMHEMIDEKTLMLIASPQSLLKEKGSKLVSYLLKSEKLRLLVVDELHLCCHFGRSFRREFADLNEKLFLPLHNQRVP